MTLRSTSRPSIRGKVLARLPATLQGDGGIAVEKENGTWTIAPDWLQLALEETVANPAERQLWTLNPTTGVYTRLTVQFLIDELPPGETGAAGDDGSLIFVQNSAPATSEPEGSLWIDADSTDLDLYQLVSAVWTDTGANVKGATGATGATGPAGADGAGGDMFKADNLSGLADNPTALGNIGAAGVALSNQFTKPQGYAESALTYTSGGTTPWDVDAAPLATLAAATGNTTMGAPSNVVAGRVYSIRIVQDSTPRTIAWNAAYKWIGGSANTPVISTGSGAVDRFTFVGRSGGNLEEIGRAQGIA